jgi:hypothetical protein
MKKDHIIVGLMFALFLTVVFMGKCNRPEPQKPGPVADPYTPVLHLLQEQRANDSIQLIALQRKIDSLQAPKKKARAAARVAIAKGSATKDCDTLRSAFTELVKNHEDYVEATESEINLYQLNIATHERIARTYAAEIEVLTVQNQNLKANYEGLQVLYERQARQLAKAERKLKRRSNANKILITAAAVAAGIIIL